MLVKPTALHLAVYCGLDDVVKVILPWAGALLNLAVGPRRYRRTPIHVACSLGRRSTAKLLSQHGANVDALDS